MLLEVWFCSGKQLKEIANEVRIAEFRESMGVDEFLNSFIK